MPAPMTPRHAVSSGILVLCAATLGWAQVTPSSSQQQPSGPRAEAAAEGRITITGCLLEERNVAGLQPNIFERLGIGEDFILTAAVVQGQEPKPVGTSGSTAAAPAADMYQVVGLDDERLREHAGRRVEVTGLLQPGVPRRATTEVPIAEGAQTGTQPRPVPAARGDERGAGNEPLARIHAAEIRQVEGDCSAKP